MGQKRRSAVGVDMSEVEWVADIIGAKADEVGLRGVVGSRQRGAGDAESVPSEPHRLMADVDAALEQQVCDLARRQRVGQTGIVPTRLAINGTGRGRGPR